MSSGSESETSALEILSAMTDGELDAAAAARACSAWRDDASMRSTWHAYQLIGDVLRSDDLASPPGWDAAFLESLRARLVDEPTVLAPDAAANPAAAESAAAARFANGVRRARWSWMAPSAVAAGFVLVAGALMVIRAPQPGSAEQTAGSSLAQRAPLQLAGAPSFAASDAALESQTLVVDGKLMRDARLERYLNAHKQFAGSTVLGVPSGFLRNAAVEAPSR